MEALVQAPTTPTKLKHISCALTPFQPDSFLTPEIEAFKYSG